MSHESQRPVERVTGLAVAMCARCGRVHRGPRDCSGTVHTCVRRRAEHEPLQERERRESFRRSVSWRDVDASIPSWWSDRSIVTAMRARGHSVNEIAATLKLPPEDVWEMTTLTSARILALEDRAKVNAERESMRRTAWCSVCNQDVSVSVSDGEREVSRVGPDEARLLVRASLQCARCDAPFSVAAIDVLVSLRELSRHLLYHSVTLSVWRGVERLVRTGDAPAANLHGELIAMCTCGFEFRSSRSARFRSPTVSEES